MDTKKSAWQEKVGLAFLDDWWDWCDHCQEVVLSCPRCGNSSCTGGGCIYCYALFCYSTDIEMGYIPTLDEVRKLQASRPPNPSCWAREKYVRDNEYEWRKRLIDEKRFPDGNHYLAPPTYGPDCPYCASPHADGL